MWPFIAGMRTLHQTPRASENCRVTDAPLREGLQRFMSTCGVARAVRRGMRIGHIGQRIDFFWTTIINESELLERFNVEILPLDLTRFIEAVKNRAAKLLNLNRTTLVEKLKRLNIADDGID